MASFKNPFDPDNKMITQKVIDWVRTKYRLDQDHQIEVVERGCEDSSCLCVQTHITFMDQNLVQLTVAKPLTLIRKWDFF